MTAYATCDCGREAQIRIDDNAWCEDCYLQEIYERTDVSDQDTGDGDDT